MRKLSHVLFPVASCWIAALLIILAAAPLTPQTGAGFQSVFRVDKMSLGTKGTNPYFNLTPGYQLEYRDGNNTDTLTVLNETKIIDGVETRVVEDREMKNGAPTEVTRDYYASIPQPTTSITSAKMSMSTRTAKWSATRVHGSLALTVRSSA